MAELKRLSPQHVALVGSLGDSELLAIRAELEFTVGARASADLTVDLSELSSVGSEVLSLLLCAVRRAKQVSCKLSFQHMPVKMLDVAKVGGLSSLLPLDAA